MKLAPAHAATFACLLVACGATPATPHTPHSAPAAAPASAAQGPPPSVPLTVVSPEDAIGIDELFARALDYEKRAEHAPAAEQFDRIVELDPEGPFAAPALYNGALAHEGMLDFAGAAYRFEETARRFPQSG